MIDKFPLIGACLIAVSLCAFVVVILRLARKPSFTFSIKGLGVEISVASQDKETSC